MSNVDRHHFNSIIDAVEYYSNNKPTEKAFVDLDDNTSKATLSFEQLASKAKSVGHYLSNHLDEGDRALLVYPSGIDFIISFFGCLYAKVIAVPVIPPTNKESAIKLQNIFNNSTPKIILSNQQYYTHFVGNKDNQKFEEYRDSWLLTDTLETKPNFKLKKINNETIAFLQFTSGSTGSPKGVMVSHSNLIHNLAIVNDFCCTNNKSITVSWLPFYHDLGLIGCMLEAIYSGHCCYIQSPLSFLRNPFSWLQAMSTLKATKTAVPNFALDYCTRKITAEQKSKLDLSAMEYFGVSSEPINKASIDRFYTAFKECGLKYTSISTAYGLAEATLNVSANNAKKDIRYLSVNKVDLEQNTISLTDTPEEATIIVSSGKCSLDTVIVDPYSHHEKRPGEIGEVWIRGKSVTRGYWNNPELTKKIFHAKLTNNKDNDSYLRSGDLGFVDNDNHLYITGRISDVLIIQGKNIYPHDIEAAVDGCHQAIRPGCSAVFSDTVNGQEEIIICSEIRIPFDENDLPKLYEAIEKAVVRSSGHIPYCINLLKPKTSFKTSSGKIQRKKTKVAYQENTLTPIAKHFWKKNSARYDAFLSELKPLTEKQREVHLKNEIKTILKNVLFIEAEQELNDTVEFQDLGIDSLMATEIWKSLQALSGPDKEISKTLLFECTNLSGLCNHLKVNIFPSYFPTVTISLSNSNKQSLEGSKLDSFSHSNIVKNTKKTGIKTIFMTGSTGILGAYLTKLFLEQTTLKLHCLIRAESKEKGYERLKSSLLTYGIDNKILAQLESRVTLHIGYLESETLGLIPAAYETLCQEIDLVIHAAANLSLQDSYEELYETNVAGTQNMINLCLQTPSKRLIYVSSYAVMGDIQFTPNRTFSEQDLDLNQGFEDMGYQKTKFEAEHLVRKTSGLNWQITRVGDLFGDSRSGAYPLKNNPSPGLFYDIFKTMIESQVALTTPLYFDITPVDYAASALLQIALNQHNFENTYHITNSHHLTFAQVMQLLNDCGYPVELISAEEYINRVYTNQIRVNGKVYKSMTTKLAKFRTQYLLSDGGTAVDCQWTQQQLKDLGIECPRIDEQLLHTLLDYCFESGYIATPHQSAKFGLLTI